jgi:hypothetical protein
MNRIMTRSPDGDYLMFVEYARTRSVECLHKEIMRSQGHERISLWHIITRLLYFGDAEAADYCLTFIEDPMNAEQWEPGPLFTALELAADRPDIARWMIDRGADIHHRFTNNWTLLHVAAREGYVGVASAVIQAGMHVDIGTVIDEDRSPLMEAASCGKIWSVMLLAAAGADVNRKEIHSGRTPIVLAETSGNTDVVDLLKYWIK